MSDASGNVGTELLFENEDVRVWDVSLKPGESGELHRHYCDYVIAYVTPFAAKLEVDGEESCGHYDDGYVQYRSVPAAGSETQRITNVGDDTHRHIVVELLRHASVEPRSDSNGRSRAVPADAAAGS